jgi:hypothetical protein
LPRSSNSGAAGSPWSADPAVGRRRDGPAPQQTQSRRMAQRRIFLKQHPRGHRSRCRDFDVPGTTPGTHRGEVPRAARANYLDSMSHWRPSSLVHLFRLFRRSLLWAPRGVALRRRRTIRLPALLWVGLRKPTRSLARKRAWKGTEDPNAIGREFEHIRLFSGQAERHALANLRPSTPLS